MNFFDLFLFFFSLFRIRLIKSYVNSKLTIAASIFIVINHAYGFPSDVSPPTATIVVADRANLGYKALTHTVAHVLNEYSKNSTLNIRVIIETPIHLQSRYPLDFFEGEEDKIERNSLLFNFPNDVDVLWLEKYMVVDYEGNFHRSYPKKAQFEKAQRWIDESTFTVIVASLMESDLIIPNNNCIYIDQIQSTQSLTNSDSQYEKYKSLINNFFPIYKQVEELGLGRVEIVDFMIDYWSSREGRAISYYFMSYEDLHTQDPMKTSLEKLNKYLGNDKKRAKGIPDFASGCHCKYAFRLGLGEKDSGILINPVVLEKVDYSKEDLSKELGITLSKDPMLSSLLEQSRNSNGDMQYFMAYKHSTIDFAEYLAVISQLKESGDTIWVLSNLNQNELEKVIFLQLLKPFNIKQLVLHNTKNTEYKELMVNGFSEGAVIHLVELGGLDEDSYISLLANSTPPFGATSNTSLFTAITLNMLPVYSPNSFHQSDVNQYLARFDYDKKLYHLFNNEIDPNKKAAAINKISKTDPVVRQWADNIKQTKSANSAMLHAVDELLQYPPNTPATTNGTYSPTDYSLYPGYAATSLLLSFTLLFVLYNKCKIRH